MQVKNIFSRVLILFMTVGLLACSGNIFGTDEPEPPAIPNLENAQFDVSYFEGSEFSTDEHNTEIVSGSTNFENAQDLILGFSRSLGFGPFYPNLLNSADDPTFKDGVWEWNNELKIQEGFSFHIRLAAERDGSFTNWEVFTSSEDSHWGQGFDDFNIMSGTTQNDGLQGEWFYNETIEGGKVAPHMQSNWRIDSETKETVDIVLFDNEDGNLGTIHFEKTGSEYLFIFEIDIKDEVGNKNHYKSDAEIFWNTDADIGYILQDDEKQCWQGRGQDASDIACSDVGL